MYALNKYRVDLSDPLADHNHWDTEKNVGKTALELADGTLAYCGPEDKWYVWDGKVWIPDSKKGVHRFVESVTEYYENQADIFEKRGLRNTAGELRKWAKKTSKRRMRDNGLSWMEVFAPRIDPDEFDKQKHLFNVQNGVIDLRTGDLLPHDSDRIMTNISPVEYDPAATCPTWDRVLGEIFGDYEVHMRDDGSEWEGYVPRDDLIDYMQIVCGYTMTGEISAHKSFFLYGFGSNGKTTFTEIISEIMGSYHEKLPMIVLTQRIYSGNQPELAKIPGKRMISMSETEEGSRLATALYKDLVGGDKFNARPMYGHPFQFNPVCKLWQYGNHKPNVPDTTYGMWRRLDLIPFDSKFNEEYADEKLPEKLRAELPGILNWMVTGAVRWYANRDAGKPFPRPQHVANAVDEYKTEEDHFGDFFDFIIDRPTAMSYFPPIKQSEIHRAYVQWMTNNNNKKQIKSSTMLGRAMAEKGYVKRQGKPAAWYLVMTPEFDDLLNEYAAQNGGRP